MRWVSLEKSVSKCTKKFMILTLVQRVLKIKLIFTSFIKLDHFRQRK